MDHNSVLFKKITINVVFFQKLLEIELKCLDTIHVVLKFLLINKILQDLFF